jgi:hypothetical protein
VDDGIDVMNIDGAREAEIGEEAETFIDKSRTVIVLQKENMKCNRNKKN